MAFALIALPILLILPQPDLGSALVFSAFLFVLYREGMSLTVLLGPIGIGILFVLTLLLDKVWVFSGILLLSLAVAYFSRRRPDFWRGPLLMAVLGIGVVLSVDHAFHEVLEDRHRNRIDILLGKAEDPKGIGYNTQQSLIAIGSGGLSGKGFLQGTQTRYDFVPEQTTDFIFCTVGEEWGFLGSSLVVLLFTALLFRLIFWPSDKNPFQQSLWLRCCRHPIPALRCEHRHDGRAGTRYRYSAPIFQLRRLLTLGIHSVAVHFPAARCLPHVDPIKKPAYSRLSVRSVKMDQ